MPLRDLMRRCSGTDSEKPYDATHPFADATNRSASLLLLLLLTSFFSGDANQADQALANGLAHRCNTDSAADKSEMLRFLKEWLKHPASVKEHSPRYVECHADEQERLRVLHDSLQQLQRLAKEDTNDPRIQAAILWHIICIAQAQWLEQRDRPRVLILRTLKDFKGMVEFQDILKLFREIRDIIRHPPKGIAIKDDETLVAALYATALPCIDAKTLTQAMSLLAEYCVRVDEITYQEQQWQTNIFAPLSVEPTAVAAQASDAAVASQVQLAYVQLLYRTLCTEYARVQSVFNDLPARDDTTVYIDTKQHNFTHWTEEDRLVLDLDTLAVPTSSDTPSQEELEALARKIGEGQANVTQFRKEILASYFMILLDASSPLAWPVLQTHADIILSTPPFSLKRLRKKYARNKIFHSKVGFIYLAFSYQVDVSSLYMLLDLLERTQGKTFFKSAGLLDMVAYLAFICTLPKIPAAEQNRFVRIIKMIFDFAETKRVSLTNVILGTPLLAYLKGLGPDTPVNDQLVRLLFTHIDDLQERWYIPTVPANNPFVNFSAYCRNAQAAALVTELMLKSPSFSLDADPKAHPDDLAALPPVYLACTIHQYQDAPNGAAALVTGYNTAPPIVLQQLLDSPRCAVARHQIHGNVLIYLCEQLRILDNDRRAREMKTIHAQILVKMKLLLTQQDLDLAASIQVDETVVRLSPFSLCYTYRCPKGLAMIFNESLRRGCYQRILDACISHTAKGPTLILGSRHSDKLQTQMRDLVLLMLRFDWKTYILYKKLVARSQEKLKGTSDSEARSKLKKLIRLNRKSLEPLDNALAKMHAILRAMDCEETFAFTPEPTTAAPQSPTVAASKAHATHFRSGDPKQAGAAAAEEEKDHSAKGKEAKSSHVSFDH